MKDSAPIPDQPILYNDCGCKNLSGPSEECLALGKENDKPYACAHLVPVTTEEYRKLHPEAFHDSGQGKQAETVCALDRSKGQICDCSEMDIDCQCLTSKNYEEVPTINWMLSHIRRAWREGKLDQTQDFKARDKWIENNLPMINAQLDELVKKSQPITVKIMTEISKEDREKIANILRNGITFSGQVGDYVIHGAIDEIGNLLQAKDKEIEDLKAQAEKLEKENKDLREGYTNDTIRVQREEIFALKAQVKAKDEVLSRLFFHPLGE